MKENFLASDRLLDLNHTLAAPLLRRHSCPWEALPELGSFILELGKALPSEEYEEREEHVWVAKSAEIFPTATILPPTIIGPDTQVRPGAFIRGNALVGAHCVVGNSTELKNVILFDNVQVPHYNYVGDSILGFKSHMGAGAVTSNVKQDKSPVIIRTSEERVETGLKKFGAVLGDFVEVGCNSVLNPGTVVGRESRIYPLSMVRGYVPPRTIHKNTGEELGIRQ